MRRPEPSYLRVLESDRHLFASAEQFEHWKRHYASELERGDYIKEVLGRYVRGFDLAGARVLDVGCGDGGVAIAMWYAGGLAMGLEPSRESLRRGAVRVAEHGMPTRLLGGVAETLPFGDGVFDLVILDNVLEHVSDRERSLSEAHRVLRGGGLLYLVTPKPYAVESVLSDPHYHLPFLVLLPRSLQRKVVEARFGAGSYEVGWIPSRPWVRRALQRHAFQSLVSPRELWISYLRHRLAAPEAIRRGPKRALARRLGQSERLFRNPLIRRLLDVALGSNFFIARKVP